MVPAFVWITVERNYRIGFVRILCPIRKYLLTITSYVLFGTDNVKSGDNEDKNFYFISYQV